MATPTATSQLVYKLAKRKDTSRPVVVVHQPMREDEKTAVKNALRDWEDKLNEELPEGREPFAFSISEAAVVVHDVANDTTEPKNVVLVHLDEHNTYSIGGREAADCLNLDIIPELQCPEDQQADIVMTVVKPLCSETGVDEWADDVFCDDRQELGSRVAEDGEGRQARPIPACASHCR